MEDRILETHVIKWIKSVEVIDANKDRFEDGELQAYLAARNIFSKNRPNMELLANSCATLKEYLDGGVKDKLFTAVRDFLKTTEIGKDNFKAFKELLEDRGFFVPQNAPAGGTDFQGSNVGTATYRRIEENGNVYEGMFLGNERVWKGKIKYANGDFYEGEWDNDGPHGEGVLVWFDGTKLTGRFNGFSGNGKIEYASGSLYEGPWNEKGPNGQGVWHIGNRTDYGEYKDGFRVGKGRMEWDDGDWYEGDWNDMGANGQGVWRIGNHTDRGEYKDHCRVGKGRIEWDNGDWYEGGWNDKGPNGQGVWRTGNRTDRGEYKDGFRVGKGRMEWDNGDWYEGGWNEKGYHGKGSRYINSYDRTDIGEWENDNETGNVVMKWKNGNTYTGSWSYYSNGQLNGVGEYYYSYSGKTRSGRWENGKWKNDWATPRNIIACVLFVSAVFCIISGSWLIGIGLGIVGKFVYEGR